MSTVTAVKPRTINPLLGAYLKSLARRPILTKSCTSATLSLISELLAQQITGQRPPPLSAKEKTGIPPVDLVRRYHQGFKMGAYGFFISAPLGHTLLKILQKLFQGKIGVRWQIAMIVVSNLVISPLQNAIYLATMSIIGGANSALVVWKAVQGNFFSTMKLSWLISTLSMATAQKFVPPDLWIPFFNLVGVTFGTFLNIQSKRKAMVAEAKKAAEDANK